MDIKRQISQTFWQGLVRLIILHQANLGPVYGGRLIKYFRSLGYEISPGSLYPLLHSLEKANFLHCRIRIFRGRARKYYELTPEGQDCLEALRQEVRGIVREVILGDLSGAIEDLPPECTLRRHPSPL
ncbi:MAG: PadR family transcriptional regulator [Desulfobaccales bacterium]